MLPTLTPRLLALAELVRPCGCAADIGTDHAYLPAWLCLTGRCQKAIASDLRPGPLARAAETLRSRNLTHRIELRLGDGASVLAPGEAQAILMAGMGGLLMGRMLREQQAVLKTAPQLLFQPMTNLSEFREALFRQGYTLADERLVREGEKLYHILEVRPEPETRAPEPLELFLGRPLLQNRPEHFEAYCLRQRRRLDQALEGLSRAVRPDPARQETLRGLLDEMDALHLGMGGTEDGI